MKKRIITSFKLFETSIFPGGMAASTFRKITGSSKPDEMSKEELEKLLIQAKLDKDEEMIEEIEELISQVKVTELQPKDYKILIPPPPPGEDPPPTGDNPPPPGGDPPPPRPGNEQTWPPKGSNPDNPPPPGDGPREPGDGPGDGPGDKKKDKPDKPNPAIIGKKARITSGPYEGQVGTITGITPEGKVTIQPD